MNVDRLIDRFKVIHPKRSHEEIEEAVGFSIGYAVAFNSLSSTKLTAKEIYKLVNSRLEETSQ